MKPAQSPAEPPGAAAGPDTRPARRRAALRRYAARALASWSARLRRAADTLTRLRWRIEDDTPRKRAVAAGHPSVVLTGYAQGRADLQLIWRAPRSGGYRPADSVPEPASPPRGPAGASHRRGTGHGNRKDT